MSSPSFLILPPYLANITRSPNLHQGVPSPTGGAQQFMPIPTTVPSSTAFCSNFFSRDVSAISIPARLALANTGSFSSSLSCKTRTLGPLTVIIRLFFFLFMILRYFFKSFWKITKGPNFMALKLIFLHHSIKIKESFYWYLYCNHSNQSRVFSLY